MVMFWETLIVMLIYSIDDVKTEPFSDKCWSIWNIGDRSHPISEFNN